MFRDVVWIWHLDVRVPGSCKYIKPPGNKEIRHLERLPNVSVLFPSVVVVHNAPYASRSINTSHYFQIAMLQGPVDWCCRTRAALSDYFKQSFALRLVHLESLSQRNLGP